MGGQHVNLRDPHPKKEKGGSSIFIHFPPSTSSARVTQLARGFSSTWKAAVESLSQDVMRSFSNFKNGTGIIQVGSGGFWGRGGGGGEGS